MPSSTVVTPNRSYPLYCTLYFSTLILTCRQPQALVALSSVFVSDISLQILQCALHWLQLPKAFFISDFALKLSTLSFQLCSFCWKSSKLPHHSILNTSLVARIFRVVLRLVFDPGLTSDPVHILYQVILTLFVVIFRASRSNLPFNFLFYFNQCCGTGAGTVSFWPKKNRNRILALGSGSGSCCTKNIKLNLLWRDTGWHMHEAGERKNKRNLSKMARFRNTGFNPATPSSIRPIFRLTVVSSFYSSWDECSSNLWTLSTFSETSIMSGEDLTTPVAAAATAQVKLCPYDEEEPHILVPPHQGPVCSSRDQITKLKYANNLASHPSKSSRTFWIP